MKSAPAPRRPRGVLCRGTAAEKKTKLLRVACPHSAPVLKSHVALEFRLLLHLWGYPEYRASRLERRKGGAYALPAHSFSEGKNEKHPESCGNARPKGRKKGIESASKAVKAGRER